LYKGRYENISNILNSFDGRIPACFWVIL
jgi:hypothetical protein